MYTSRAPTSSNSFVNVDAGLSAAESSNAPMVSPLGIVAGLVFTVGLIMMFVGIFLSYNWPSVMMAFIISILAAATQVLFFLSVASLQAQFVANMTVLSCATAIMVIATQRDPVATTGACLVLCTQLLLLNYYNAVPFVCSLMRGTISIGHLGRGSASSRRNSLENGAGVKKGYGYSQPTSTLPHIERGSVFSVENVAEKELNAAMERLKGREAMAAASAAAPIKATSMTPRTALANADTIRMTGDTPPFANEPLAAQTAQQAGNRVAKIVNSLQARETPALGAVASAQSDGDARSSAIGQRSSVHEIRVRAVYSYTADPSDPSELSFAAGEMMRAADVSSNRWWSAMTEDGRKGIVPSNYMEVVRD